MEGYTRNGDGCPQLLDLISKESREWVVKRGDETITTSHGFKADEKKLELSLGLGLGPPGGEWTFNESNHCKGDDDSSSLYSFGYFPTINNIINHKFSSSSSASPWPVSSSSSAYQQLQKSSLHVKPKESSQHCCNKVVVDMQQSAEKKAFSPVTAAAAAGKTAVSNSSQKRTAPAPVVGWPPIRSFRKNLTSSSSSLKSVSESPNAAVVPNEGGSKKPIENGSKRGMFVKINMDCIPIGRKVDLKAYDSYEKLSSAVDELFRGLLAAQNDSSADSNHNKDEREKAITGLLDGTGEYTLVYEDNEGDRMLVGDVPWHMFVATVKRLRVLKSSELPMLRRQSKHGKLSHNS